MHGIVSIATMGNLLNRFDDLPIMEFMLFLTMTVAIIILAYMQFKRDQLDLRWLILDDNTGKPSIHKIGQGLALLVSTWGFVKLVLSGTLTEAYFTIYMGVWAGSTALNQYLSNKLPSTAPPAPVDPEVPK